MVDVLDVSSHLEGGAVWVREHVIDSSAVVSGSAGLIWDEKSSGRELVDIII